MITNALDTVAGWGFGLNMAFVNKKEDEVRQGKNYYFAAPLQAYKVALLSAGANFFIENCTRGMTKIALKVASFAAPFLSMPVFFLAAASKQDDYTKVIQAYNTEKYTFLPRLPEELGPRAKRAFSFIADHSGNIMRVAGIIVSVAACIFVSPYYGGACIVATLYEAAEKKGYVPRKVALFVEKYLGIITTIGNLVYGGVLVWAFNVTYISTHFQFLNKFLQHRLDDIAQIAKKRFNKSLPPALHLKEFEAPLKNNKNLSFDEVMKIIQDKSPFVVDPAHCSKATCSISNLPEDRDFSKLLTLFKQIDWKSKYQYVRKKLLDDERFIDFIKGEFPNTTTESLRKNNGKEFDSCIGKLAKKEKCTKKAYFANWLERQMNIASSKLQGTFLTSATGQQVDLEDSINYMAKVIPYLETLKTQDPIGFEDLLLKIAVEGGDFCNRGLKRTASETIDSLLMQQAANNNSFELVMRAQFQNVRQMLIQMAYNAIVKDIPKQISNDVHTYDMYRAALSLGFCPLSELERRNVGLGDIAIYEMFTEIREVFLKAYQEKMDENMKEFIHMKGAIEFAIYAKNLIEENKSLSSGQKEELTEYIVDPAKWGSDEVQRGFRRFALVSMGMVKKS